MRLREFSEKIENDFSQVEDTMEEPDLQRGLKGTMSELSSIYFIKTSSIFVHQCLLLYLLCCWNVPSLFLVVTLMFHSIWWPFSHVWIWLKSVTLDIHLIALIQTMKPTFSSDPRHTNIALLLFPLLSWLDLKLFKNLLHLKSRLKQLKVIKTERECTQNLFKVS